MSRFALKSTITAMLMMLVNASEANLESFPNIEQQQWMSLSKSVQFLPAPDVMEDTSSSPVLRRAQRRILNYFQNDMVDGMETEYNDYAQAWRLLGFYTDCNAVVDDEEGQAEEGRRRRKLEDEGNDEEEDADGDDANDDVDGNDDEAEEEEEEEVEEADDEEQQQQNGNRICKRYLLWAAYVDLNYEGNGLSEYKIYNTSTGKWDNTACKAIDTSRCVKMDCHLRSTGFKPLGYFRQDYPVEFLQLLAQHQGSCSLTSDEAAAMASSVEWLPQGCTKSATTSENNKSIYFDLKPTRNGGIDIGLYVDNLCSTEYTGSKASKEKVLSSYYGYDVKLDETMTDLNTALDHFKVCNPCRTFDLSYKSGGNNNNNNNNNNNKNQNNRKVEEEDEEEEEEGEDQDPNNMNFVCADDAGYAGVNQCMMIAQNSNIEKASIRDVNIASRQGTINRTYGAADAVENWWDAWGFFTFSLLLFIIGIVWFCGIAVKRKRITSSADNNKNQPLIQRR